MVACAVAGSAHRAAGTQRQDEFGVAEVPQRDGSAVLVAAVADGAGSAPFSGEGASAAIDGFRVAVSAYLDDGSVDEAGEIQLAAWLAAARAAVSRLAAERDLPARQFACTFLGAVVGASVALFVQVGDGMMVCQAAKENSWHAPIEPQRGEYRNETYFLSDDDAERRAATCVLRVPLMRVALSTDGLEDLYFERSSGTPYAPFFEAVFETVATPQATDDDLSRALERYLDSEAVNALTSDDKTLVLAARH